MSLEEKSKFVSYVLRHKPESIGLELDPAGWAEVDALLRQAAAHGHKLSRDDIPALVNAPDKKRFALSEDGLRIRALHGHSVAGVNLGYVPQTPPDILFHGTATRFLDGIRERGILPAQRQYVHLAPSREKALEVGKRHGKAVLLEVDARRMHADGFVFYLPENGVWLTLRVPVGYFRLADGTDPQ